MVATVKEQGKRKIVFAHETYASLDEALSTCLHEKCEDRIKVAFASYITWLPDNDIAFYYHDTAIVVWHTDGLITVNTGGFMGRATQDKINFALEGYGYVQTAWDGSKSWLLHLVDPNGTPYEGRSVAYHDSVRLYDGLTFDSETGEVVSTEPTIPATDFQALIDAYKTVYNGKGKTPAIDTDHVSPVLYDTWLDKLVAKYCEQVVTAEHVGGGYNHTREDCDDCDCEEESIDRAIENGDIVPGGLSGTIKEASYAWLRNRTAPGLDVETGEQRYPHTHLLEHVLSGDYNSTIPWVALTIAQRNPSYWLRIRDNSDLMYVRRYVSKYLRRRLHRSIINV